MKISISDIVKNNGASLDIKFEKQTKELKEISNDFIFERPITFQGRLLNVSGILKLDGTLSTTYRVSCARCLSELQKEMTLQVSEEFVNKDDTEDTEQYTYDGNFLYLEKPLLDNILLNMPARQVCSESCKGLCLKCGQNLNKSACQCTEDIVDERMKILKNFFND